MPGARGTLARAGIGMNVPNLGLMQDSPTRVGVFDELGRFADYLWNWMERAAAEYGLAVSGGDGVGHG